MFPGVLKAKSPHTHVQQTANCAVSISHRSFRLETRQRRKITESISFSPVLRLFTRL